MRESMTTISSKLIWKIVGIRICVIRMSCWLILTQK